MELKIENGIAELISDEIEIKSTQDALDIIMNGIYSGADKIIVRKEHLLPEFFDLKTKIAGDILQKFSTYNARLAIIGDFENLKSKSLKDFIYESNRMKRINFVASLEAAKAIFQN